MSDDTLRIYLPRLPHTETFSDPALTICSRDGLSLLTYDPATRCGLVYLVNLARWTILQPVSFDGFALFLASAGIFVSEGPGVHRWIAACRPDHIAGGAQLN